MLLVLYQPYCRIDASALVEALSAFAPPIADLDASPIDGSSTVAFPGKTLESEKPLKPLRSLRPKLSASFETLKTLWEVQSTRWLWRVASGVTRLSSFFTGKCSQKQNPADFSAIDQKPTTCGVQSFSVATVSPDISTPRQASRDVSALKLPNRQKDSHSIFVLHDPHRSAVHRHEVFAIIPPLNRLKSVLTPVGLNSPLQLSPERLGNLRDPLDTTSVRVPLESLPEPFQAVLRDADVSLHRSSRHVSPW